MALHNGRRSPKTLLRSVVARPLGSLERKGRAGAAPSVFGWFWLAAAFGGGSRSVQSVDLDGHDLGVVCRNAVLTGEARDLDRSSLRERGSADQGERRVVQPVVQCCAAIGFDGRTIERCCSGVELARRVCVMLDVEDFRLRSKRVIAGWKEATHNLDE
jgi:hypothetical protein